MKSSIKAASEEIEIARTRAGVRTRITRVPPAILLVYPSTLFLGFLYALLSPDARLGANNTSLNQPVNYFAKKSNILNRFFVKIGWFWTSLAFCAMLLTLPGFKSEKTGQGATRRCWQACLRYMLVTLSWVITTQWAFGPPLVDRGFTATGGKCSGSFGTADNVDDPQTAKIFSQAECKLSGGKWKGGRDISGHVFMLALMSAFLFMEWYGASQFVGRNVTDEKRDDEERENMEKKVDAERDDDGEDVIARWSMARANTADWRGQIAANE
ncbi:hypothetical protein KEM54_005640 [Ascosphaera aggregata]|nr:hypothetical protein KEM54_005640 [Ascosphaera aggregata]